MHTIEISKILQLSNPKTSKVFAWISTVAYHPYLAVNLNPVFKAPDTGRVMIYQLLIHIDCLKIMYKRILSNQIFQSSSKQSKIS